MTLSKDPDSPLANVASEIEERRCELTDRHRHLRGKVAAMERSIPALMTCNIWKMANDDRGCRDAPYRIVRQIVDKFSPQPDPADRLLAELKSTVNDLRLETAHLHDKIIDADVKLEETTMELESLELANKEMEEKLMELRNRAGKRGTPSLHSIHSEDLICLRKIRHLAEEELDLKTCIKELENKEDVYKRQMKQFLPCVKFQRNDEKATGRIQGSTENGREKTCCSCPMSVTLNAHEQPSMKSSQACRLLNLYENLCSPLFRYIPLDICAQCSTTEHKTRGNKASCESLQSTPPATFKSRPPYTMATYRESAALDAISNTDVSRSHKHLTHSSVPCDYGEAYECETCALYEQIDVDGRNRCRREKRNKLSTTPCNRSAPPLNPRVLMPSETLRSRPEVDDGISDEFCECCTCDGGSEESM